MRRRGSQSIASVPGGVRAVVPPGQHARLSQEENGRTAAAMHPKTVGRFRTRGRVTRGEVVGGSGDGSGPAAARQWRGLKLLQNSSSGAPASRPSVKEGVTTSSEDQRIPDLREPLVRTIFFAAWLASLTVKEQ